MMLSHPVLLGLLWSLLFQALRGQSQISNQENKVYSYSYHFQHNGTANSKDILRSVLGTDPEFGFDNDGKSIVKTFSSPGIRGFFTKGVLPAGPITHNFNNEFRPNFNSNPSIDDIKKVIQSNLQPPPSSITGGLLPPISQDIKNKFPGDFNNINDIGINFHNQEDFPKIPPQSPVLRNQDFFPKPSPVSNIPPSNQNDFPIIPQPRPIPPFSNVAHLNQIINNNNGINKIETFEHNTPNGGKVSGQIETFSYNPPPISNTDSNYHENAQGFRRNENFVNSNRDITGHRTQTFFRQQFRTVSPNLNSNNRLSNRNIAYLNNNDNQWWNALNVLGGNNGNNINSLTDNNINREKFGHQIDQNINQMRNNFNKEVNQVFGSRLGNSNNRDHFPENIERIPRNRNNGYNNENQNFNEQTPYPNQRNQPFNNVQVDNQANNNGFNNEKNNGRYVNNHGENNGLVNNHQNNGQYINNQDNGIINRNQQNVNNKFNNDDTTRRVLSLINDVSSRWNNPENFNNDIGVTWDDVEIPKNFNHDWSRRQTAGVSRPFSNGHSGPLNNPVDIKPVDVIKTSIEALIASRDLPVSPISDVGNNGGNYRNVGGGGFEKFFGINRIVESPNSFSQNQQRGFERNFQVNSNVGYQRNNQWSTNTLRRLDAQSTKDDFSKDFIDVFREDY